MADSDMSETMQQIEWQDGPENMTNLRKTLKSEISDLEIQIKAAQKVTDVETGLPYGFNPVSPEQANEQKRIIVFLKKDLAQKRLEYERLNPT